MTDEEAAEILEELVGCVRLNPDEAHAVARARRALLAAAEAPPSRRWVVDDEELE